MNRLADHVRIFDGITPWGGYVPQGYQIDFIGTKIDLKFRKDLGVDPTTRGDKHIQTRIPTVQTDDEGWFEAFNWVAAAREARESFVMMTLGACFGYQATGCFRALRILNPDAMQTRACGAGARKYAMGSAAPQGQRYRSRPTLACSNGSQRHQ